MRRACGRLAAASSRHGSLPSTIAPASRSSAPGTRPGGLSGSAGAESEADLGRHFYLNKVLETWAARPATRMTLRQLIFFGKTLGKDREKILKSAAYVRQELPVRIAHRIRDLQALPFVVMTNQHLENVYNKYWSAFETLRRLPPIRDMDDNERFCNLLKGLLDDHLTIIPSLTIGIVESSHHLPPHQLDKFMERMLRSRISRRVLAEQHIALSEALDDPFHFFNEPVRRNDDDGGGDSAHEDLSDNHVGIIYTHLSVASVVRKGVKLLTEVFAGTEGISPDRVPEIRIDGDLNARFAYIPEHLEYIIFELLKNAIRSTIRQHAGREDAGVVRVTIVEGPPAEDLIIRISDSGGGLPDLIEQLSIPSGLAGPSTGPQYPIPFPETGHVGGYDAAARHAAYGSGSYSSPDYAGAGPHTMSMDPSPSYSARGGVGSAGGMAGSQTGHDTLPSSSLVGPASAPLSPDSLIDALCSFSNVRRRLELEGEATRIATERLQSPSSSSVDSSASAAEDAAGFDAATTRPTPTRDQFHALRRVGKFKGTVTEQMAASAASASSISSSPSSSSTPSSSGSTNPSASSGGPASVLSPLQRRAYEGTGPAALHTVQVETGLGLPMAKVYCDFFGGSLSLRSLDGHSTDVYVRLPKLGTSKESIPEVVL
ncbi:related to branched chain alpha-ketoacid dehydrogenase kinase [Pseudozyma flocculosa]|uniref:Protein-serine/threonine kinase n=1 Tax=Pseudozyma flocculosa TaxID=84751 RepID=A0A5C3F808_9BASI|nr:related to branched chain alpha-ketoacid dehydrogenase kinase [Pseudozyma flocculosa]